MDSDWHTVYVWKKYIVSFFYNTPCPDRVVEIPFASAKHASIAKQVIVVDAELNPQAVKRELSVHDNKLIA